MSRESIKIVIALVISLLLTQLLSIFFLANSPRLNDFYLASLFAKKPTATPTPTIIPVDTPTPTIFAITPNNTPLPTKIIPTPTLINPVQPRQTGQPSPTWAAEVPTKAPVNTPTPTSPNPSFAGCPQTSSQQYTSLPAERLASDVPFGDPATSPEINLHLRGFTEVNESTSLISRNGNTYGLDPIMPPQISSLYGGPVPQIIKTYRIYEWDFTSGKSAAPATATPQYPVHMLGLQASPGQPLLGLKAGRDIGGGHVFMVLYATPTDIVFTHSNSDTLMGGYLFYFLDICVDPNLLTKYNGDNAGGRNELPVIATGQVFGYAGNSDVKIVVRDTMSFMDTRYKEDWWDWQPWQ